MIEPWSHKDAETLYNVSNWGAGFFRVNLRGNLEVLPNGDATTDAPGIDLHELIGQLRQRGIQPPILLRFDGILRARVHQLCAAFAHAIEEYGSEATYRPLYPIKVNQQRHVVEALLEGGREHGMGIEVGSKPELLAGLALHADAGSLLVCNGYKDDEYVETALLGSKLGVRTIVVIEKFSELRTVLRVAERLSIRPTLGVRTKISSAGSGRWRESGGQRSKFGLTTRNVVELVDVLVAEGMLDCLELLHFHLGSQVTNIRSLKAALREATRTLTGLAEMGVNVRWFDVGGGLGVDYDGSSTNFESSVNYSLQEYANDVVYQVHEACESAGIPAPTILSESGRALTAHHAVLVCEVLGVTDFPTSEPAPAEGDGEEPHPLVTELEEVLKNVSVKNFQESYHDALHYRDDGMLQFNVGQLSLRERARIEELFWRCCQRILQTTREVDYVPDDLATLPRDLADTYFLNFSLFQSMPDSWAIGQLFPVLPLHRHLERPTRRAVLADITCDSDGKVDRFIDLRDVKRTLELHPLKPNEPYYLGAFLVGAYQEILGDMHNLFGDTNVVHVDSNGDGRGRVTHVVPGDRVREVLSYVEYFEDDLLARLRRTLERAIEEDRLSYEDSALLQRRYESGLQGYTYLVREDV